MGIAAGPGDADARAGRARRARCKRRSAQARVSPGTGNRQRRHDALAGPRARVARRVEGHQDEAEGAQGEAGLVGGQADDVRHDDARRRGRARGRRRRDSGAGWWRSWWRSSWPPLWPRGCPAWPGWWRRRPARSRRRGSRAQRRSERAASPHLGSSEGAGSWRINGPVGLSPLHPPCQGILPHEQSASLLHEQAHGHRPGGRHRAAGGVGWRARPLPGHLRRHGGRPAARRGHRGRGRRRRLCGRLPGGGGGHAVLRLLPDPALPAAPDHAPGRSGDGHLPLSRRRRGHRDHHAEQAIPPRGAGAVRVRGTHSRGVRARDVGSLAG